MCCFGQSLFSLCLFEVVCSGVTILRGSLQKRHATPFFPNDDRGHSDIAALSLFTVWHALHLVSEYHALFVSFFHLLSWSLAYLIFLFPPTPPLISFSFLHWLWLSLYMSVQLSPLLALLLVFLIQPQKKHTGCKLIFCALFVYLFIYYF